MNNVKTKTKSAFCANDKKSIQETKFYMHKKIIIIIIIICVQQILVQLSRTY